MRGNPFALTTWLRMLPLMATYDLQVVIGRLAIALDHIVRNARGQVGDPDLAVLRRAAVGAVLVLAEHFFAARCRRLLAKRDLIRDRILALRSSRPLDAPIGRRPAE
jgi:hypothetical protein